MPKFIVCEVMKTYATTEIEASSLEAAKEIHANDMGDLEYEYETDFGSSSVISFEEQS